MDKFVSPSPPPEGLDRELLTVLTEECGKVTQRACKALRFGIGECQPGQPLTNAQRLAHEVGDILETVDRLVEAGVLQWEEINIGKANKKRQLAKFLQSA